MLWPCAPRPGRRRDAPLRPPLLLLLLSLLSASALLFRSSAPDAPVAGKQVLGGLRGAPSGPALRAQQHQEHVAHAVPGDPVSPVPTNGFTGRLSPRGAGQWTSREDGVQRLPANEGGEGDSAELSLSRSLELHFSESTSPPAASSSPPALPPPPPSPPPPPAQVPEGDRALLARALRLGLAPAPRLPRGTPRVALLFLTPGPLPLAPLWARFLQGHEGRFSLYIHTSEHYVYSQDELPEVFQDRQIPSKNASWGHISLVDAERRLLAHAFMDPLNERFVLLSPACVPLHPFPVVYSYLTRSNHSHVEVLRSRTDDAFWSRALEPLVPFPDWRKGSQWFEVQRALVPLILRDEAFYLKFGWTFLCSAYADEHYLPTLLHKQAPGALANRTVTWVHWPRPARGTPTPHPVSYHEADVTQMLLKYMRWGQRCKGAPVWGEPCHLFARKFHGDALPALLRLSWLLGY